MISSVCVLIILCLTLPQKVSGVAAVNTDTLRFVTILFRHGDRAPIEVFPNDTHKTAPWPEGLGQLTNIGKQQHYELGRYIRDRYKGFLNNSFNVKEVYVRSTDVDRTLMSAYSNLAGLYPAEGDQVWNSGDLKRWQPIPVHTVADSSDYLLKVDTNCPSYADIHQKNLVSPEMIKLNKRFQGVYDVLAKETGANITNIFDAGKIYDCLFCEKSHNLTLPPWVSADHELWENMTIIADLCFSWFFHTSEQQRLRGGPLLGEIVSYMEEKSRNNKTYEDQKLRIYSAHDTTVAALLSALQIFNGIAPPYASAVLVELHLGEKEYEVEIFYKNVSGTGLPYQLSLPGCPAKCPLENFHRIVSEMIPDNIQLECQNSHAVIFNGIRFVAAILAGTLGFILIVTILAGLLCWKKRQSQQSYRYLNVSEE